MTEPDPHSPMTAGPTPDGEAGPPEPEPATAWQQPAGSGLLGGGTAGSPTEERPELLVGAAFAGGVVAAILFKRLMGGRG